ncbi:hypothetical protein, partial [Mycobacterium ulcerans]|uniref:hypothetical protein n=1 Tax=Mycobacterium ulcerans TaxID=1809 RepID=UPI001E3FC9E9
LCSHSASSFSCPMRRARLSNPVAAVCASGGVGSSRSPAVERRPRLFAAGGGRGGIPGRAS